MTTTDPRPLWLLDVDGVLNAVGRRPDRAVWSDWRHGTAHAEGVDWPIRFSPTVTATVARLHLDGLVEVRWLTTWGRHANGPLRELLGLPEFEVVAEPPRHHAPEPSADPGSTTHGEATGTADAEAVPEPGDGDATNGQRHTWWKLHAAQRVAAREPGRPVIWTDDDLTGHRAAVNWAEVHLPRRLLLGPRPTHGLTPRQLRAIRTFVADDT